MRTPRCSSQLRQQVMLPTDQRCLLFPAPPLDAPLTSDRVLQPLKIGAPDQFDGAARMGIAVEPPGTMLGQPLVQPLAREPEHNKSRPRSAAYKRRFSRVAGYLGPALSVIAP